MERDLDKKFEVEPDSGRIGFFSSQLF